MKDRKACERRRCGLYMDGVLQFKGSGGYRVRVCLEVSQVKLGSELFFF